LKGVDTLRLTDSNIEASNGLATGANDILRYSGTNLEWITANNFALNVTQDGGVSFLNSTDTLTNKTLDFAGGTNTALNIPNSALANASITFGTQEVFLGGTVLNVVDTDTRYELQGAVGAPPNSAEIKLNVYNLDNSSIANPTPGGDKFVRVLGTGDITVSYSADVITIGSTFTDTNTTYTAPSTGGLLLSGTAFSLRNSGGLSADTILKWDDTNNQLVNTSLTENATDLQTTLNFTAQSLASTGNSTIGGSSATILQLRSGTGITRQNSTIRAFLTDGPDVVSDLFYDSSTTPNIRNSTWKISAEDGTIGAVAQIQSIAVPAANNDPGTPGQIRFDGTHIYFCVDTDSWIRALLDTF